MKYTYETFSEEKIMKPTPAQTRNILLRYYANLDKGMTKYLAMKDALTILDKKK